MFHCQQANTRYFYFLAFFTIAFFTGDFTLFGFFTLFAAFTTFFPSEVLADVLATFARPAAALALAAAVLDLVTVFGLATNFAFAEALG